MNRFVGNLLDITRLEAGVLKIKKELYDLQDLLGSCLASLGIAAERKKCQGSGPLRPSPDPHGLRAHGPGPGESDGKRPQVFPSRWDHRSGRPDGRECVEIEVADQGPGVPQEHLGRISINFSGSSAPKRSAGTGLGLAH